MLDGNFVSICKPHGDNGFNGRPKEIPDVHICQMFVSERTLVGNTKGESGK